MMTGRTGPWNRNWNTRCAVRVATNMGKKVQSEKTTSCVPFVFPLEQVANQKTAPSGK